MTTPASASEPTGGSGSVTNALSHGLPMLVIPLDADPPLNAARGEIAALPGPERAVTLLKRPATT